MAISTGFVVSKLLPRFFVRISLLREVISTTADTPKTMSFWYFQWKFFPMLASVISIAIITNNSPWRLQVVAMETIAYLVAILCNSKERDFHSNIRSFFGN